LHLRWRKWQEENREAHNKKLHNLHPHQILQASHAGEMDSIRSTHERNSYRILVEKSEGERPPGRPKRRKQDDIKVELKK
jgi:hypothetical protein